MNVQQSAVEDLLEPQVSEDAFALDPVLAQYQNADQQARWLDELKAARDERKKFDEQGRKVLKRYTDERDAGEQGKSYFNIFYANTEIKMAALFARSPSPSIKRRFDDSSDDVARVGSLLLQRNLEWELEQENFDTTFKQVLFDRCVPGIGVLWSRLEQDIKEPDLEQITDPLTGEVSHVPVEGSHIADELACLDYVAWDDFIWAPCRVWTECRWLGRRIPMSKQAIKDRFKDTAPANTLLNLSFNKGQKEHGTEAKDPLKPKHIKAATVDVFEIWDKETGLIWWISEHADVPLDVQADTNEFPDFFPTPLPPLGSFSTSNTIPISDYALAQDQYRELDDLNNRANNLVKALQLRWAYDAESAELKNLYSNAGELQGIPVKNWNSFNESGGIKGAMQFAPLDEIAATYQKLLQARDMVKSQIYEVEGISDIMRAAPTPYESAAATNQKSAYGATRIGVVQQQVADYIQRALRLKTHLICKFYLPRTILMRAGELNQADQQLIGPALQLIKDKQLPYFRLSVSVDSIQLPNWNQEKQERNEAVQAIANFIGQVLPAFERTPGLAPLGLELLKFSVAGYKGAQEVEGAIDNAIEQMRQAQAQQSQNPPPPSADQIKLQIAQIQAQTQQQVAQIQAQTETAKIQADAASKARDQDIEAQKLVLREREVNATVAHKQAQQHIDTVNAAHSNAIDVASMGGNT